MSTQQRYSGFEEWPSPVAGLDKTELQAMIDKGPRGAQGTQGTTGSDSTSSASEASSFQDKMKALFETMQQMGAQQFDGASSSLSVTA